MKRQRLGAACILSAAALSALLISGAGCRPAYESIEVDGQERQYVLHVPKVLPEGVVPLVLALHQFSDTPEGMRRMTGFDLLADQEGFIVAYPKGRRRNWQPNMAAPNADHHFLLALIDALSERFPIDPSRIYATGASAGAMMTQALACHSNRLAAIAPVMGSLPKALVNAAPMPLPVPTLIVHGLEDPVIPYAGGQAAGPQHSEILSAEETAAFWARAAGCDSLPEVETVLLPGREDGWVRRYAYSCPDGIEVTLCAVSGCGHTWPGGRNRYPRWIVGPSVDEPDASALIWDFLKRHVNKNARSTAR